MQEEIPMQENEVVNEVDDLAEALGAEMDKFDQEPKEAEAAEAAEPDIEAQAETVETEPVAQDETNVESQPETVSPEDSAPSSWTKTASGKWSDLPAEVRAEIHKRESDYHKGIEQYKQSAIEAQGITDVLRQNQDLIQASGVAPEQAIAHLMQAHRVLTYGTQEQKRNALAVIARDSGIDLTDLQPAPPLDPQVRQLMEQNRQLQQFQQQTLQYQNNAVQSEIEAFANDPANVHFDTVREDMGNLLQSGMAQTLAEAYEKAVWARPDLRQSLIEDERTKAEKRAAEQAQRQRAKSAAVGVRGSSPNSTGAMSGNASLEDTVAMAIDGLL